MGRVSADRGCDGPASRAPRPSTRRGERKDPVCRPMITCATLPPLLQRLGLSLVMVPEGQFLMGSRLPADDDPGSPLGPETATLLRREQPQRTVYLDAFCIARYPVTVEQFGVFLEATGRAGVTRVALPTGQMTAWLPVHHVPREEADLFCRWLTMETQVPFRLPTEAEWEKAARGTDGRTYPWGEEDPPGAFCNCSQVVGGPSDVRSYPSGASPWGCLDMAGNVWEWCADWYAPDYYLHAPDRNPGGPPSGWHRVIRGGCFSSHPHEVRCASRFYDRAVGPPFYPCGFRVVTQAL